MPAPPNPTHLHPYAPAPLNVAVLGLGRMGRIYAHTLAEDAGARLYAVADPDAQARAAVGEALRVPYVLETAEAALALPDLDAVVVATPTDTHAALVVAAAAERKAIFCEKPLALTRDETYAALAAVEHAGVPLQVGFMRRFDAAYVRAKALIDAGRIGRPVTFKAVGRDPFCPDPAFADPARSGGLLLDMGIHDFDLARWLVGDEVTHVSAAGARLVCGALAAVDDFDNAVVNLRFAGGALGNVEVSRTAFYGYDVRTEVLGSEGVLRVGGVQSETVTLLTRDGAPPAATYLTDRFGDAYRAQVRHFVECLRTGRPPAVTGADAAAAFEVAAAATEAARAGEWSVVRRKTPARSPNN